MIIAGCFVIGCDQDESEKDVLTDEEMLDIVIKSKYVTIENDQYVIHLSREKAVYLGISEEFYLRMVDDTENINAIIREGLEREKIDSTFSVVLPGRQTSQEQ
jgi:hypothetical protein